MKKLYILILAGLHCIGGFTQCFISSTHVNVHCYGASTGSINLTFSGVSPYTYSWNIGATTEDLSGLPAGFYEVVATDWFGCVGTLYVIIDQPSSPLSVTGLTNNISCFGSNDGSIDITPSGGSPSYSYNWSNAANTQDISGLGQGTYTVTVHDTYNCTTTFTTTVTEPSAPLSISDSHEDILCFGTNTGAIDITLAGGTTPYTYSWSNGASSQDISGIAANNYTVTVTDAAGCTDSFTETITALNPPFSISSISTDIACYGDTSGSINITPSGGSVPYSYLWTNAANTEDITDLVAGIYEVTLTDINGCTTTYIDTLQQPAMELSVASITTNNLCYADTNGIINITPSGGSGGYNYLWSNSATTEDISGLNAGTYNVTLTDVYGCSTTSSIIITADSIPTIDITGSTIFCEGGNVTLMANSSSNYLWSNGNTTQSILVSTSGIYWVEVASSCGTYPSVSVPVTVNPLPPVNLSPLSSICINNAPITLIGGSPFGGVYSGTGVSSSQFNPATSGLGTFTITYTYTNGNGCTDNATNSISVLSCLGTEDNGQLTLDIYPNPVDQIIYISGLENDNNYFSISDMLGRNIKTGKLNSDGTINVENIVSGTYYLQLNDHFWKIIKN